MNFYISLILHILLLIYHSISTNAVLSYPTGKVQHGRRVCTGPSIGVTSTFNTGYAGFTANPIVAIGISGMSSNPPLSIDFNTFVNGITTTGFVINIQLSSSTTFSSIKFYYLAISQL